MKIDPSLPPTDASAIQSVTPSDIYSWPGPDVPLTQSSERTGIENNWYALTGRVVALKVEADGDLHIALQDATGDKPGIVVVEVPAKPQWCEIRTKVFNWTPTRFPFHTSGAKKLTLNQTPVVIVTGKAFFDVGHSLKDQKSNQKSHLPGYAIAMMPTASRPSQGRGDGSGSPAPRRATKGGGKGRAAKELLTLAH